MLTATRHKCRKGGPMSEAAVCLPPTSRPKGTTMVFPAGTIKRVHVNQHVIRRNKKTGECENVITIQWKNKSYPVSNLRIQGSSEVVYSPSKPLSCGAHVWVETRAEITAVF
jgi:hypothetical protein